MVYVLGLYRRTVAETRGFNIIHEGGASTLKLINYESSCFY